MFKWPRKPGDDSKANVGDTRIVAKSSEKTKDAGWPDLIAELVSIVGQSRVSDQPSGNARLFDQSALHRGAPHVAVRT
jgi:hypothetical protein